MDDMTAGFYQAAPEVFGECISIVLRDRLHRATLLPSQRKSAVILLHEKGSRAVSGNYRLDVIVQVIVRVLSKALTHRLHQVIPYLIHFDQNDFVKGSSIITTCAFRPIFKTCLPVGTKKRTRCF